MPCYLIIGKRFENNEVYYFFANYVAIVKIVLISNVVDLATVESFKKRVNNYYKSNATLALFSSI